MSLPRQVSVHSLVPLQTNERLQNVCLQMRVLRGNDYGQTFAQVLELGITQLVQQHRLHDFPAQQNG